MKGANIGITDLEIDITIRKNLQIENKEKTNMDKKLSPELKELNQEYDFLHKMIGDLEWKIATVFYGKKAVRKSELDILYEQLDNYRNNMGILIERVKQEVEKANNSM